MVRHLLFTPAAYHITPFREWVPEVIHSALVLCSQDMVAQYLDNQIAAVGFADYYGEAPLCAVWRLSRQAPIESITVLSEFDLLRAARMRSFLGLSGQSAASAEAFRNKLVMKRYVSAQGIPVPAFAAVDSAFDIIDFVQAHGLPVVVKPVDAGGSMNVTVIQENQALEQYLGTAKSLKGMMVERYVSHDMLHVDGLAEGGAIVFGSVSRYVGSCLDYQRAQPLGSVLLEPGSRDFERAVALARRVVRALPAAPFMGFHLELFEMAGTDDALCFCEIASRIGGARVNDCVSRGHGVNLAKEWVRRQSGVSGTFPRPDGPFQPCGWVVVPPTAGTLRRRPETVPSWMEKTRWEAAEGDTLQAARNSVHGLVSYLVVGDSPDQVRQRISESTRCIQEAILIEGG